MIVPGFSFNDCSHAALHHSSGASRFTWNVLS